MRSLARLLTVTVLVVVAATVPVAAAEVYLPKGGVDGEALIDPPPAHDSAAFKEQMAIVLWLQESRTPEQVAFVSKTLDLDRFAPILGASLFQANGAALATVFDDIFTEVTANYDALKAVYDEPHPYQVNADIQPVGDARPVASYPSGHAIRATVFARLLAEIFPEHRDALLRLAAEIGYGRVVAGVHYPVDVTAGFVIGNAYADVIIAQDAFKEAVKRIRSPAN